MFKAIRILFLCIVFLASNFGFAFNIHICGGSVSEISVIWNKAGCDMPDENKNDSHQHSKNFKAEDCCNDDILIVQKSDPERILVKQMNNFSDNFSILLINTSFVKELFLANLNLKKVGYPPPAKLFLLFSSFIFYG